MEDYTFLCIRRDGSIPAIDIQTCPSEADALRRLKQLFHEHDSAAVIEVWAGSRRVSEVPRRVAPNKKGGSSGAAPLG